MAFRSFTHRVSQTFKPQRALKGQSVRRLRFELLDDRRMLSFTPAVNHATIGTPSSIVTADFNKDGNLDLATCANALTGSVSVLLGDGAGGFGEVQRTVFGSGLSSLAVADFNNDTRPDLLVSDIYNGASALIGNGDGTFQAAVPLNLIGGAGKDVVAVGRSSHGSTEILVTWFGPDWQIFVQVYAGNLQGGFIGGQDAYYWGYGGMAPVDLNNDGPLDVVTSDGVVFLGGINQSLSFDDSQSYPLTGGAVATGDFTGDGNADVIVAGNSVAVLRGRGDGSLEAPIHHSANGTSHTAVATADFNGDGWLDAIMTDDTGTASLMLGDGDGTLHYVSAFATGTSPSGVVVGDFNGDGRPDVAVSNAVSKTVSVLLNDGVWPGAEPAPGDFDGDGDVDGRDFLKWQRGESPNPLSSGDLELWQGQYGENELLAVSSQLLAREDSRPEQAVRALLINTGGDEHALIAGTRVARSGLHLSRRETASVAHTVFEDSYVEEVDRAIEQFVATPSGVRSFGEMVARRGKLRRVAAHAGD